MPPVLLALASGLAWGAADFLGGTSAKRRPLATVLLVSQLAGFVFVGAVVLLRGVGPPSRESLAAGLAGGVAGVIGLGALYRGLAVGTMGLVAPTAALSGAVPVAWGLLVRGERPSPLQLAGVLVAIAGIVAAARAPDADGGRSTRGLGLALLAALAIGMLTVALDGAGRADPSWATLAVRTGALCTLALVAAVRRPELSLGGRDAPRIALTGVLDNGANLAFAMAADAGGLLALNGVLGSLYPVTTVVLARVLLRERMTAPQRAGVAAALLGVALIAAG